MAKYFRIAIQRNSDTLHLKLIGEFDGSSARELFNIIQKNCNGASRIFIYTSSLKRIHPFERQIFVSNLNSLSKKFIEFGLMGDKAGQLVLGHGEIKAI
jgi:hypothetical protein